MSTIPKYHSLSTILNRVKTIIDTNVSGKSFWLKVEIANINFHRSGHIFLELAEIKDGKTIAKCKGIIWDATAAAIQKSLGNNYNAVLRKGNEILCFVQIDYKIAFGLSIRILEVNIDFAVGQIEKRRQETIDRLNKEGLLNLNKKIYVPLVIKNIALIASKDTSGYQDFVKNLSDNQYGYQYNIQLFSSSVQGNSAQKSIINNLKTIDLDKYDCVVLIRGGGSKMDLDVFNSYEIAKQVSQMSNAVFSGIGHETDVTVIDFVVNQAFKTPTEVSNHILNKSYKFEQKILANYGLIMEKYSIILERRTSDLKLYTEGIVNASNSFTQLRRGSLHTLMNRLIANVNTIISQEKNKLSLIAQESLQYSNSIITNQEELIKKRIEMLILLTLNLINKEKTFLGNALIIASSSSPKVIINKGFIIPRVDGKLYKGAKLNKDTIIKLEFKDSVILTKYVKKEKL